MNWSALGGDPAPGDVGAINGIDARFAAVSDQAETLLVRLRTIDFGSGSGVWRGPASDAFRDLLAQVGPQLTNLATSYRSAHDAMSAYARALDNAQFLARQAEVDAERSLDDRALAEKHRGQAHADAMAHRARKIAAELGVVEAEGLLLSPAALIDPTYAAAVRTYGQQQRDLREHAATREAEANGRATAAQREADEAGAQLDQARGRGQQAKDDHHQAVTAVVRALEEAGNASGIPLSGWQRAVRNAHGLAGLQIGSGLGSELDFLRDVVTGRDGELLSLVSGTVEGSTFIYGGAASKKGKYGSAGASYQAFGADGRAEGRIGILPDGSYGAHLGAEGSAYLLRAAANAKYGRGPFSAEGDVNAMAGVRGSAAADARFGRHGGEAKIKAEGFVGVEATANGTLGAGPLKEHIGASAQAGIGGAADLNVGLKNGKFSLGGELGLSIGVGAKINLSTEIDVGAIGHSFGGVEKGAEKKFKSITKLF